MIARLAEARIKVPRMGDYVHWSMPSTKPWIVRIFSRSHLHGTFPKSYLRARNPRRLHVDPMVAGKREFWIYRGDIYESSTRGLGSSAFLEQLDSLLNHSEKAQQP